MSARYPVVVIVGRPNVGKSTFFNRIIGRTVAVVEDNPGVTRDRLYSEAEWNGKKFILVDTGGILFADDDPLIEQIRVQAEVAIAEADVVLFLVDVIDGISAGDYDLANELRRLKKPIYIVANKADNKKREDAATEFYELGIGEVKVTSGLNGKGIADLLDDIVADLPAVEIDDEENSEVRLAIVGRPNVGKSSMLNAFTGEERAIVSNIPGTTRDAIDTLVEYHGQPVRLIDTAGLRRRGKIQGTVEYYMALRSTRAVERSHCVLVVVDGSEGLTDGDKRTMKLAHDEGRALVIAVNKWDLVEPPHGDCNVMSPIKKEFVKNLRAEIPEVAYAPVRFTSAKEATGLNKVMDEVMVALNSWNFKIGTGALNRLIQDAVFERPFSRKGRLLKVFYATQVAVRPPTFAIFCNEPDLVHFSYQRYLENRLRNLYPLVGTSIRTHFRGRRKEDDD